MGELARSSACTCRQHKAESMTHRSVALPPAFRCRDAVNNIGCPLAKMPASALSQSDIEWLLKAVVVATLPTTMRSTDAVGGALGASCTRTHSSSYNQCRVGIAGSAVFSARDLKPSSCACGCPTRLPSRTETASGPSSLATCDAHQHNSYERWAYVRMQPALL